MSNDTTTNDTSASEAAENAHRAWAAVANAHEQKKGTKRLLAAAVEASATARAVLTDHDTPENGTAEEAEGIAEQWAAVWADTQPEEELTEGQKMSLTLQAHKSGYKPTVTHKGTKSLHNGDNVAVALAAMEPHDVARLAERLLGLEAGTLLEKYQKLNPGQIRMNSGNRIRGAIRRGDLTAEEVVEATGR